MQVDVKSTVDNQIGVLALSREKALNSLTHSMIKTMHRDVYSWSRRDDITFLLFPSLEQKVYCAGGDIRWLYEQGKAGSHEQQMAFFADEYRLDYAISQYPKPVVAIVDGFLIGGGMGLLMPSQTVYATERASFAMPETGIGFFPDVGMSYLFGQCPGFTGLYLALTGQRINAFEAQYLGLVAGVLKDNDAIQLQNSVRQGEDNQHTHKHFVAALEDKCIGRDEIPIENHRKLIDDVFSSESVDVIIERLSTMSGSWAEQTLKQLQNACPLSLKVTFALMHKAQKQDQAYAYQQDHVVAHHFMHSADFYEGVRAQVIDKDRTPNWQYQHVSEIPQSVVEQFFVSADPPLNLTYRPGISEIEKVTDH